MSRTKQRPLSNMIHVGNEFAPFQWNGETLVAWIRGAWYAVRKTGKKNEHGDFIFEVV